MVGLEQMDRKQSEVGYWIVPAFWNSGLASEAVGALIDAQPVGVVYKALVMVLAVWFPTQNLGCNVLRNGTFVAVPHPRLWIMCKTPNQKPMYVCLKRVSSCCCCCCCPYRLQHTLYL